jgi:hypothetical protein
MDIRGTDIMKNFRNTAFAAFVAVLLVLSSCARVAERVVPVDKPVGLTDPDTGLPLYYSSLDEAITPDVLTQQGGTCWAYAAVTAIDYAYQYENGTSTGIDPVELTEAIFDTGNEEGIFLDDDVDPLNAGGNGSMVMDILSRGYDGYFLTESVEYEDADMTDIKNAIMEYGAVSANISAYETHFINTRGTTTFIADAYSGTDHDVVLVGWNDDFPADAFAVEASCDGAWLAQNSYGPYWGDGGYFWISYDTPFTQMRTYTLSTDYSEALSYCAYATSYWQPDTTLVANHYPESGTLEAVGTYIVDPDTDITVTVYSEDLTEELYTTTAHFDLPGYYTVELDDPLEVNGFFIAIDFGKSIPCEGRSTYRYDRNFVVTSEEGQSYVFYRNEWIDVTESDRMRSLNTYDPVNNFFIVALMG